MRRTLLVAVVVLAAFALVTIVALEGRSMAVLETTGSAGELRRTRVWFAEQDGALWIESADASRPFYTDLAQRPALTVELHSSGLDRHPSIVRGDAELVAEPGGHERIRSLLEAKYGWADCWVGMLTDTSASRAVRIAPSRPAT